MRRVGTLALLVLAACGGSEGRKEPLGHEEAMASAYEVSGARAGSLGDDEARISHHWQRFMACSAEISFTSPLAYQESCFKGGHAFAEYFGLRRSEEYEDMRRRTIERLELLGWLDRRGRPRFQAVTQ